MRSGWSLSPPKVLIGAIWRFQAAFLVDCLQLLDYERHLSDPGAVSSSYVAVLLIAFDPHPVRFRARRSDWGVSQRSMISLMECQQLMLFLLRLYSGGCELVQWDICDFTSTHHVIRSFD